MAASNRYMNWTGASFTPAGGSAITLDGVLDCSVSRDGQVEEFKGDLAVFVQLLAMPTQKRKITLSLMDVGVAQGVLQGARGAFTIKLADAVNGITTAGGGVTIALTACMVVNNDFQGPHASKTTGSLAFEGYASDGATDPLTITAL